MGSEWTIETLKEFFEEKFGELTRALDIQATEYKRRLDELNHAHAREQETLHTYLPREIFDKFVEDTRIWRNKVEVHMAEQSGKTKGVALIISFAVTAISTIAAIGMFVINIMK